MAEDKIIKKLLNHDKRFDKIDKRFTAVDARFDKIDKRFTAVDARFDKVEDSIHEFRREYLTGYEEMITILKRLDEERVFTVERVNRLETRVDQHDEEITQHGKELQKVKLELKVP